MLAYLVYVAYEVALPISLTDTHGLSPAAWGFLVIINPAARDVLPAAADAARERASPPRPKLVVAMLLMGLPFLLLSVSAAIPVIALVIVVFVLGEMLWVPTSQSVVAGARAGGRARRVHGRVRQHRGGRVRAGAVLRPPGTRPLRRRRDVGDVRGVLGGGGARRRDRRAAASAPGRRARASSRRGGLLAVDRRERERIMRQGVVLPETPRERRSWRRCGRISSSTRCRAGRCGVATATSRRTPAPISRRSAVRCRTWRGCARSRRSSRGTSSSSPSVYADERRRATWLARCAERWSFDEVNDLIDRHNRWYPVEARLPMDPQTGDFVLVNGEPYREASAGRGWVLERFPASA